MIPELSSEPRTAAADPIAALGRMRHGERPWVRPICSLLACASAQLPSQASPGTVLAASAPTVSLS
jgi:hypothetical protein